MLQNRVAYRGEGYWTGVFFYVKTAKKKEKHKQLLIIQYLQPKHKLNAKKISQTEGKKVCTL